MIRLICCDLDGTLVRYGTTEISDEVFGMIRQLRSRNILFAPASGRPYEALRKIFEPVADQCLFLCDNGGMVYDEKGNALAKMPLPAEWVRQIARDFWENTDGLGELVLSGEKRNYALLRGEDTEGRITHFVSRVTEITDLSQIREDIVKISVHIGTGVAPYADRFTEKWACANCAVAGPVWIDCTFANKGTGIRALCDALGIPVQDVAAVGDNYNDVPMLDVAGHPYLMDTAAPELLQRYPVHIRHPADLMRELLRQ